jgi:hypothetical protein
MRQNQYTDSMRIRILAANLDSKACCRFTVVHAVSLTSRPFIFGHQSAVRRQLTLEDEAGSKGRGGVEQIIL